jgi:hypothetical protein
MAGNADAPIAGNANAPANPFRLQPNTEVATNTLQSVHDYDEPTHPIRLLNENRRKKKKVHSTATVKNAFNSWLLYLAEEAANSELGTPPCKDGCFSKLVDDEIRVAVTNFLVWHGKKPKQNRDQTLVDWIHSSRANGHNGVNDKYRFPLPFCGDVSDDVRAELRRHQPLCKIACCKLFCKGRDAWSTIRKQADKSTVVSPHGNVGKPNGRIRGKIQIPLLSIYWHGLLKPRSLARLVLQD